MPNQRRQAFTLVELLVAMALIVFIMAILSEAFVAGLKTFRDLKAVGDMDQRLRTVTTLLRDDLSEDHFTGRIRLSDLNFWSQGAPPREGFFRIFQGTAPPSPTYFIEDSDAGGDRIPSYIATDHRLHFAVKRRANQKDRFFTASVVNPPNPPTSPLLTLTTNFDAELGAAGGRLIASPISTYSSQWAEVAYFLVAIPDGTLATTPAGPLGLPLFDLYRSELLIVPDNANLNWALSPAPGAPITPPPLASSRLTNTGPIPPPDPYQTLYAAMSCKPDPLSPDPANPTLYFNNPSDVNNNNFQPVPAVPAVQRRAFDPQTFDPKNPTLRNATLLMTDVISFQVQVLLAGQLNTGFVIKTEPSVYKDLADLITSPGSAPMPPFSFDTGNVPVQLNCVISAIKITLRVWDAKTQQARQISIIQDM